ncbi:Protein of unknown function [Gryllus bimaculatus]|nr:Protein of unknown function [Gryllus bimaculatus]
MSGRRRAAAPPVSGGIKRTTAPLPPPNRPPWVSSDEMYGSTGDGDSPGSLSNGALARVERARALWAICIGGGGGGGGGGIGGGGRGVLEPAAAAAVRVGAPAAVATAAGQCTMPASHVRPGPPRAPPPPPARYLHNATFYKLYHRFGGVPTTRRFFRTAAVTASGIFSCEDSCAR